MQAASPSQWSLQEQELATGDEGSQIFLKIFLEWFDLAEKLHSEMVLDRNMFSDKVFWDSAVIEATRDALETVEFERGAISMEWIGQMLLLAREHWHYGNELAAGLTRLEKRMMEQMEAVKLAALSEDANL